MKVTGAQALFKSLEGEGVDIVFGIPGGAILPGLRPAARLERPARPRAATSRAPATPPRATRGRPARSASCMATSGPGGCNLVTALADAKMDSVPMVAITGQVPTPVVGNDAFQEADITGITMPVTKHHYARHRTGERRRGDPRGVPHRATGPAGPGPRRPAEGRAGDETDVEVAGTVNLPGYKPTTKGERSQIREAAKLIMKAKRPVLYVGGGVIKARRDDGAAQARRHATGIPVVTTLMARGTFPDRPRALPGHARHARQLHGGHRDAEADLLIALGARFDDRVTGKLDAFAPDATVIHVDIDPAEIGKNRVVEVPIVGDCKDVIGKLATTWASGRTRPAASRSEGLAGPARGVEEGVPVRVRPAARRSAEAAVLHRAAARGSRRRLDRRLGRRPAPDVGVAVLEVREAEALDQLGRARYDGLRGAGGARCGGGIAERA